MIDATRSRIHDLVELLSALDATLEAGRPVPAVPLARVLLAVDAAAAELQRLAEALAAARPKGAP
jgi:hypothetical protein